jgi:hypothetical protein
MILLVLPSFLLIFGAIALRERNKPWRVGAGLLLTFGALIGVLAVNPEEIFTLGEASTFNLQFALIIDSSANWIAIALVGVAISGTLISLMHDDAEYLHLQVALAILGILAANVITLAFMLIAMDLLAANLMGKEIRTSLGFRWIGAILLLGSDLNLGLTVAPLFAVVGLSLRQIGVWYSRDKLEAMLLTALHLMALGKLESQSGLLLAGSGAVIGSAAFALGASRSARLGLALAGLGAIPVLAGTSDTALLAASFAIAAIPVLFASRVYMKHHRMYRYLIAGIFLFTLQPGYARLFTDHPFWYAVGIAAAGATAYGIFNLSRMDAPGWPLPETARKIAYEFGSLLPFLVIGITLLTLDSNSISAAGVAWVAASLVAGVGLHFTSPRLPQLRINMPWELIRSVVRAELALLRNLGAILEGRGAFLWMILLILLSFLVLR